MKIYQYPKCSTCRKALKWLDQHAVAVRSEQLRTHRAQRYAIFVCLRFLENSNDHSLVMSPFRDRSKRAAVSSTRAHPRDLTKKELGAEVRLRRRAPLQHLTQAHLSRRIPMPRLAAQHTVEPAPGSSSSPGACAAR